MKNRYNKKVVKITESDLRLIVNEAVNEISAAMSDRAASAAYKKARSNGYPITGDYYKKYMQGDKFLKYRNDKLSKGRNNVGLYYHFEDPDKKISLADYTNGNVKVITDPASSIAELEKLPFNDNIADENKTRASEQNMNRIVKEAIGKVLREGVYGYPDGIDGIILMAENDRDFYNIWESIGCALTKNADKGIELDVDKLANSSVFKKLQQMAFRKFYSERSEGFDRMTSPGIFRRYMAERMIDDVNNGQFVRRSQIKESMCEDGNGDIDIDADVNVDGRFTLTPSGYITSDAIRYVVDNIDDFDVEYSSAINKAYRNRSSLRYVNSELYDKIYELALDYLDNNGVEYDSDTVFYNVEEVFG